MFREFSVPGHDDNVVCESAVQVNAERARDFKQETPGFDKLGNCNTDLGGLWLLQMLPTAQ